MTFHSRNFTTASLPTAAVAILASHQIGDRVKVLELPDEPTAQVVGYSLEMEHIIVRLDRMDSSYGWTSVDEDDIVLIAGRNTFSLYYVTASEISKIDEPSPSDGIKTYDIVQCFRPNEVKGHELGAYYTVQNVAAHGKSIMIGDEWTSASRFKLYRRSDWIAEKYVKPEASMAGMAFEFKPGSGREGVDHGIKRIVAVPRTAFTPSHAYKVAWISEKGILFTFKTDDRIKLVS